MCLTHRQVASHAARLLTCSSVAGLAVFACYPGILVLSSRTVIVLIPNSPSGSRLTPVWQQLQFSSSWSTARWPVALAVIYLLPQWFTWGAGVRVRSVFGGLSSLFSSAAQAWNLLFTGKQLWLARRARRATTSAASLLLLVLLRISNCLCLSFACWTITYRGQQTRSACTSRASNALAVRT